MATEQRVQELYPSLYYPGSSLAEGTPALTRAGWGVFSFLSVSFLGPFCYRSLESGGVREDTAGVDGWGTLAQEGGPLGSGFCTTRGQFLASWLFLANQAQAGPPENPPRPQQGTRWARLSGPGCMAPTCVKRLGSCRQMARERQTACPVAPQASWTLRGGEQGDWGQTPGGSRAWSRDLGSPERGREKRGQSWPGSSCRSCLFSQRLGAGEPGLVRDFQGHGRQVAGAGAARAGLPLHPAFIQQLCLLWGLWAPPRVTPRRTSSGKGQVSLLAKEGGGEVFRLAFPPWAWQRPWASQQEPAS